MSSDLDYYRLLGISRDAPEREIKKAYYELARKLHPDKAKDEDERVTNSNKLAAISQAYNTLKDPKKRADYDAQIRGKAPASSSESAPAPAAATPVRTAAPKAAKKSGAPTVHGIPQGDGDAEAESRKASAVFQQKKSMAQKAFVRGMQHFKLSEFKQALSFFEIAATNDPDSEAQYHLKLAQCLMKTKGSFTRAAEHAERACQMDPYNLEYRLLLGDIYESAGVYSKAKDIYDEVLRWDATNREAKNRLQLLAASGIGGKPGMLDKLSSLFGKKK
ncbi:MAG: DnaJ domain-containing protein [Candidatus Sumerlaeia bacterium]|nr:DnaJ domain-containing protein [Candidatus Sumerlaeia bacterium]